MSGIFKKRPPQLTYSFIWDVEAVLDFLQKLPGNDLLSDKLFTLKVSMLSKTFRKATMRRSYLEKKYLKKQISILEPTKSRKIIVVDFRRKK